MVSETLQALTDHMSACLLILYSLPVRPDDVPLAGEITYVQDDIVGEQPACEDVNFVYEVKMVRIPHMISSCAAVIGLPQTAEQVL